MTKTIVCQINNLSPVPNYSAIWRISNMMETAVFRIMSHKVVWLTFSRCESNCASLVVWCTGWGFRRPK